MINDLLPWFQEKMKKEGDKIVIENHVLSRGIYFKVYRDGLIDEPMIIEKRDEKEESIRYKWFRKADYYSTLINMNKSVDPKKKIHSCNYLSIFIKNDIMPETGDDNKALSVLELNEAIERYFHALCKPNEQNEQKMLDSFGIPQINIEYVNNIKEIFESVLPNISKILKDKFKKSKGYVKIFFDEDEAVYRQEYLRYSIPKIYNKNTYNVYVNGEMHGLSSDNMGMNEKKPYLEHMTTNYKVPYRIPLDQAIISKKMFSFINSLKGAKAYIPARFFESESLEPLSMWQCFSDPEYDGAYYYFEIGRGKEVVLESFDYIPKYRMNVNFKYNNYLNISIQDSKRVISSRKELCKLVNHMLYRGRLFNPEPKVKTGEFSKTMLSVLKQTSEAAKSFFNKSDERAFRSIVDKTTRTMLHEILVNNKNISWGECGRILNLRLSLLEYFNIKIRGENMGSKVLHQVHSINERIRSENPVCRSDEEFYFLAGQISRYLVQNSEAKDKRHDMIEPFLRSQNAIMVKKNVKEVYKKYNHAIKLNYAKFSKALAMIMDYDTEKTMRECEDLFIAGFLAENIFFKSDKEGK